MNVDAKQAWAEMLSARRPRPFRPVGALGVHSSFMTAGLDDYHANCSTRATRACAALGRGVRRREFAAWHFPTVALFLTEWNSRTLTLALVL